MFKDLRKRATAGMATVLLAGSTCAANIITNPSFETPENTTGGTSDPNFPTVIGDWGGDQSSIVTAENGIVPAHLTHMLKFTGTSSSGAGGTVSSQVWQLIDMAPYAAAISAGTATAVASVLVNRVASGPAPSTVDTLFAVNINAYSGTPANFPTNLGSPLGGMTGVLFSDSNLQTWEPINTALLIPTGTTYLAIQLIAQEDVMNDTSSPEFAGHYADLAMLDVVVPEPSVVGLVALAGAFAACRRPRRAR